MVHAPQNDPSNVGRYQAIDQTATGVQPTGVQSTGAIDKTPANDVDGQDPTVGQPAPAARSEATKRVGLLGRLAKTALIAGAVIAVAIGGFFGKQILDQQPPKPVAPIEAPVLVNPGELPDINAPPGGETQTQEPGVPVREPGLPSLPSDSTNTGPQINPSDLRIPAGQFDLRNR